MRMAGLSAVTRFTSVLAAGSPSTMARRPPVSALAAASLSRRSGIFFAVASGPWQRKHLSDRIGLTSRLNSRGRSAPQSELTANRRAATEPFMVILVFYLENTGFRHSRKYRHDYGNGVTSIASLFDGSTLTH